MLSWFLSPTAILRVMLLLALPSILSSAKGADPDPPPVVERLDRIDADLRRLERKIDSLLPSKAPTAVTVRTVKADPLPPPVMATTASVVQSAPFVGIVPQGMHAHRTTGGAVIVHGNENLGSAAAHAGIERPWIRIAEAGQTVSGVVYAADGGGCPNGVCPTVRSRVRFR